jgi:chlorobactene glucosyltransferase
LLAVDAIPETLPSLSIIIPARNEAGSLPHLLGSLQEVDYPGPWECLVVDDGSEDDTARVAASFDNVTVLSLEGPPEGWSGKAYACHRGAERARGEWLLFTDADTIHTRDGAAQAVAYARAHHLDGLSLFLRQQCSGAVDGLALMTAYAGYFASLNCARGVLNGQYILLRRHAYEDSGGFATVPREITEDLALGHHLLQKGYDVPVLRGDLAGSVRMYHDAQQLWYGLARFTITSLRWTGLSAAAAILFIILAAAPLQFLWWGIRRRGSYRSAFATWLATALALSPWASRFGNRRWAWLAPFGGAQVQYVAAWGLLRRLLGRGVTWKGRVLQ